MTSEEKINQYIWKVLQDISEEFLSYIKGKPVKYMIPTVGWDQGLEHRREDILYKLEELKALKIKRNSDSDFDLIINPTVFDKVYKKYKKTCDLTSYLNDYQDKAFRGEDLPKFSQVKHSEPEKKSEDLKARYNRVLSDIESENKKIGLDIKSREKIPSEFLITIKDRKIYINNYQIAMPHAVGSNYDFFEYIRSQPADKPIKLKNLSVDLQEGLANRNFFKILNALGFKSEIKKAFFYKVDGSNLCYRGDKLTLQQLKEAGINTKLFIKELEVADAKYNPD